MKSRLKIPESSRHINQWLSAALVLAISIEGCLHTAKLISSLGLGLSLSIPDFMHVLSLLLLILVLVVRHIYNKQVRLRAVAGERQLEAMLSMLASVKHDLNNDMQVVIGNAELASIMIENQGDVSQPVSKITSAAAMAIERIEQLAVFSADNNPAPSAIDLNSALRECAAKLSAEMPAGVTLQLELAHLPIRVTADRYLLGLSLSYLIRQVVKTLVQGGEIVIRSRDVEQAHGQAQTSVASAEVSIDRSSNAHRYGAQAVDAQSRFNDVRLLKTAIDTTEALLERSGAVGITHSLSPEKPLLSMGFGTKTEEVVLQAPAVVEKYYV